MYKKITNIAVLLLCSLLTSCLGGVFYIDLGNRYAWLEDRVIVKIIEEKENSLFGDYKIPPQVLNFDYDNKYIIAYQVYDGSVYYDISSKQDVEEKDSLYAQFAILKKMKHCYWIIDKEVDHVMGPMTKSDFDKKCAELHVKAKLRKFQEKKFWEGLSMEEIDSITRKYKEEHLDSLDNMHQRE